MDKLTSFVERIENFNSLSSATQVDYFLLYLSEGSPEGISSKEISECFNVLDLKKYSNIPSYLTANSSSKNKKQKFLKKKKGYSIERNYKIVLESKLGIVKKPIVTGQLFSMEIVNNTRGYIINVAFQVNACYEYGLYDAALVMIRKLLETLIIELYEKNKIENKIKNSSGYYHYLGELISLLLVESSWSLGRNTRLSLPKIKKLGDLSAHNRRFNAKKNDIDDIKNDLRIVTEELVHLIDY